MWGPIVATCAVVDLVLVAVVVRLCSGAVNRRANAAEEIHTEHRIYIEKPDKNANGIKPKQNGVGTNKVNTLLLRYSFENCQLFTCIQNLD